MFYEASIQITDNNKVIAAEMGTNMPIIRAVEEYASREEAEAATKIMQRKLWDEMGTHFVIK